MTDKYPYPGALLVDSGSMFSPKQSIEVQYSCPQGGMYGHPIQGALYLDPRTGDTFAYCPVHRVAYRLSDNLKVRAINFSWKPISRETNRLRALSSSGGTRNVQSSQSTTLDVD